MPGLGSAWGSREEFLHPRDRHGRFRKTWKMADNVINAISNFLDGFSPRTFQSDGQSAQYLFNRAKPSRFGGGSAYPRLHADYDEANVNLRAGNMDESTKKFVKMMDDSAIILDSDIIVSQTVGPDAFGLTPEQMNLEDGGIEDFTGRLIADRGYSAANIGTPMSHGPGKITMIKAVPKGTKAIIPARSQNDRGIFLDRDQPLRITKVKSDGAGGYYMLAVATPRTPGNTPEPINQSPRGVGLTPQEREARVLGTQRLQAKREGIVSDAKINSEAIDQGTRQVKAEQPGQAPTPAPPAPTPQAPTAPGGPPPRNEPVHAESIGGANLQGKGTTEIAQTPPPQTPAPAAPAAPVRNFRDAVQEAGIASPTAGKRRAAWNAAYLGVKSGKKDPADSLRELDRDIAYFEHLNADQKRSGTDDPHLDGDLASMNQLADLISSEYGVPRNKAAAPAAVKAAPTKVTPIAQAPGEKRRVIPGEAGARPVTNLEARRAQKAAPPRAPEPTPAPPAPKKTAPPAVAKVIPIKKAAPAPAPSAPLPGTPTRLRPRDIKVGDTIAATNHLPGRKDDPNLPSKVVARIERRPGAGNQQFEFFDEKGDRIGSASPNSYVWRRGESGAPSASAAKKAAPSAPAAPVKKALPSEGTLGDAQRQTALTAFSDNQISADDGGIKFRQIRDSFKEGDLSVPDARREADNEAKHWRREQTRFIDAKDGGKADEAGKFADQYEKLAADLQVSQSVVKTEKVRQAAKAAVPPAPTPEPGAAPNLDKMTKAELLAHAGTQGVTARQSWSKDKIKEAIGGGGAPNAPTAKAVEPSAPSHFITNEESIKSLFNGKKPTIADLRGFAENRRVGEGQDLKKMNRRELIETILGEAGTRRGRGSELTRVTPSAPPVVNNPVAQKSIQAPDRRAAFAEDWINTPAMAKINDQTAAGRSINEVRDDVLKGKITPDEGIRRLENDIELNKQDLAGVEQELRGDVTLKDRSRLMEDRDKLRQGISDQEHASSFMRKHFRNAPAVTPKEVEVQLDPEAAKIVQGASPSDIREAAKVAGFGELKGESKDELLQDLVKKIAGKELASRAVKKAAPKKLAPAPLGAGTPGHVNAKLIGEGLGMDESDSKMLDHIQGLLDGKDKPAITPAAAGRLLEKMANGPAGPGYKSATLVGVNNGALTPEQEKEHAHLQAQFDRWMSLSGRLQKTRRPRKTAAAPEAAPTKLTPEEKKTTEAAAKILDVPAEKLQAQAVAKRVTAKPPTPGAQASVDAMKTMGSREEGQAFLQKRTKAELQDIAKASGVTVQSKDTKASLADKIIQANVTARLQGEALRNLGPGGKPEPTGPAAPGIRPKIRAEDILPTPKEVHQLGPVAQGNLETSQILERLNAVDANNIPVMTRKEVGEFLAPLNKTKLVEIGKTYSIPGVSSKTIPELRREIVDASVGRRLDSIATRGFTEARPPGLNDRSLESLQPSELADLESSLGIKRASLDRADRIAAIRAKRAGQVEPPKAGPKPEGPRVIGRHVPTDPSTGRLQLRDRPGNDEPIRLPNNGQDQGLVHLDSGMGQLWQDLYVDNREPNSFVNEIAGIGERVGTGEISLNQGLDMLRALKGRAGDKAVEDRIQSTINDLDAPKAGKLDIPEGVPGLVRDALMKLADIPTARRTGRIGASHTNESVLNKKLDVVRKINSGEIPRMSEAERLLGQHDLHESADAAPEMWKIFDKIAYLQRRLPNGDPNPDFIAIRDWILNARKE